MKKENISVMISEEDLYERIQELADEINKDYEGKTLKLICILKGSVMFTCELAKRLTMPIRLDFLQVSSYGSGMVSSTHIEIKKDLDEDIEDEYVLVIEDIIDSGNTLAKLVPMLQDRKPADINICTLLDKPDRRQVEVDVKYNGFEIPDEFVVGFGLDYDQKYRNLNYIGKLDFSEEE